MASYFPYGQQIPSAIKKKLTDDVEAARHRKPYGVAFVTNQKLTNGQNSKLQAAVGGMEIDVFHLERNVHILDRPAMAQTREQFIYIPANGRPPMLITADVIGSRARSPTMTTSWSSSSSTSRRTSARSRRRPGRR
jgi:hypothetical protein